jgi:hypothetical protein
MRIVVLVAMVSMETGGSVGIDSSNGNDGDNNDGSDDVKTNNGGL